MSIVCSHLFSHGIPMPMCRLPVLLLVLCVPFLKAEDQVSHQIRLVVGVVPGVQSVNVKAREIATGLPFRDDESLTRSGSSSMAVEYAVRQQGDGPEVYGLVGSVFQRRHRGGNDVTTATLNAIGIEGGVDIGYAFSPQVTWTVGPRVGLGSAHQAEDGLNLMDEGRGYYLSYSLETTVAWTIEQGVELGGSVGFMGFTATARRDVTVNTTNTIIGDGDVTYGGRGLMANAMFGYRF